MKKNIKLLFGLALGLTVTLGSCKKNNPPEENDKYIADMAAFFESNRVSATQTFTIDGGTFNMITGSQGTKIMIPANSFVDATGSPVTGSVTLELLEILDQDDMIFLNAQTVSNGQLLVSGGELNLQASQSGNPVFLTTGQSLYVEVPTANPNPQMQLFSGVMENGNLNWNLSVDSSGSADSIIIVQDSTGGSWGDYYYFAWDDPSLGWINCDYFWGASNLTDVTVLLRGPHTWMNTNVFIHFSTINSVLSMYGDWNDLTNQTLKSGNIPEGMAVTFVCISEISGSYYSAFVPATIVTNHIETIDLSPTTLTDFLDDLDNL